jgi:hypothetical protein
MNQSPFRKLASLLSLLSILLINCRSASAQLNIDLEKPPFEYTETEADNQVSRLIAKLKSGELKLDYTREHGYLPSMLAALGIPESSQTLVFSKTSMQVRYISRQNPRAIYFNDDTYVGWVNGSSLVEISTADPKLGTAFYTLEMAPWKPKFKRANYDCLGCHATSMTQGIPGHAVRSVFPTFDGSIRTQRESFITDDTSPFSKRWGGWYVTGKHGDMQHMGNAYLRGDELDTLRNGNLSDLRNEFDSLNYLSPHSDIVALMVLGHQSKMHNTMTRSDFSMRHLLHERLRLESKPGADEEWQAQVELLAKAVVDCLLFCGEAPITSEVVGSTAFADKFAGRGPKDSQNRSLRDFDLKTRMFKYPCSYLIYSAAFDDLQPPLRREIYRQLLQVLTGENLADDYNHLDGPWRSSILTILQNTKSDLPENWTRASFGKSGQ